MSLFLCVPNFSAGRRPDVIDALIAAVRRTPGVQLIDHSADPDHNRSVLTFLGGAGAIRAAALAVGRVAVERIDMRDHRGEHPRTGAIDVVPVVPLRGASRGQAVELAHEIGADYARTLALPVYYYEWAAWQGRSDRLPDLRRGGYERFIAASLRGDMAPDVGPDLAHPTAGIAIVGARGPLVAYNIDLDTPDVSIAQAVARRIREERERIPSLSGVRAIGLYLASRHRAQVSMNLTRPDVSLLPGVFEFVRAEAQRHGISNIESEIIGVIPWAALAGRGPEDIRWLSYRPEQILDTWLDGADIVLE